MPQTSAVHKTLLGAFDDIVFEVSDDFRWLPAQKTVQFDPQDPYVTERLLHEMSHSLLGHSSYSRDIELIGMERDAWHHAKTVLAPRFGLTLAPSVIDEDMDTYRDWLHARSTCPTCGATGLQTGTGEYTCVTCRGAWRVNHAIGCQLRRYKKK